MLLERILLACILCLHVSPIFGQELDFFPSRDQNLSTTTHQQNPATLESLTEVIHSFSKNLYKATVHGSSSNIVVSPFSILTVLLMVATGASGSTLQDMEHVLNLNVSNSNWKNEMSNFLKTFRDSDNNDVTKAIANEIVISDKLPIETEFLGSLAKTFLTDARSVDVSDAENVRKNINERVSNLTRGIIKEALPKGSITYRTKLILSNALYFKGLWLQSFKKENTREQKFFIEDNRSVDVPMMSIYKKIFLAGDLYDLNAKAVLLPYKDERHGLLLVLPNKKNGLHDTEHRISAYTPNELLTKMQHQKVYLRLPKFKLFFTKKMNEILEKMGFTDSLFENLNLSRISSESSSDVKQCVNVFHTSAIEIQEEGTEAAAFTGLEWTGPYFDLSVKLFEFTADHPFLFFLVDLENDAIPLFSGRVMDPLSTA